MSETIRKMEPIYDPTLTKENLAGSMRLDTMARDHVINKFDYYKQLRNFIRGGKQVQLTYDWDERYRIYKAIFLQSDHNYRGESKVFNPILRKPPYSGRMAALTATTFPSMSSTGPPLPPSVVSAS